MKIRFVQDIHQGTASLYAKGEIIECDARTGRLMIGSKHAVAADEGLKSWRDDTPGDVTMSTPQGRVAIPIGAFNMTVMNSMCDAKSTVLITAHQLGKVAVQPFNGGFHVSVDWIPNDTPSVFDYAILSH